MGMYYLVAHVDPEDELYSGTGLERCVGRVGKALLEGLSSLGSEFTVPDRYLIGADPRHPGERWWFYLDDLEEVSEREWELQQILDKLQS